jgi:flagellar protein FlaG
MSSNISFGKSSGVDRLAEIQSVHMATNTPKRDFSEVTNIREVKAEERKGSEIPISEEQLVKAIEHAIKSIQGPQTSLDFSIHKQTKRIMVKVLNKDTGEVIREIPPEKQMDLLANLWEMAGILVDERR